MTSTSKSNPGHFFEDFSVGMPLVHATPQTLTEGDIALYRALTGGRFVQYSSSEFAKAALIVYLSYSLVKKGDMIMKERRAVAGGVGGVGVGGAHRVRQEARAPRAAPRAATLLALPLRALADETHRRPPVALLAKAR